MTNPKLVPGAQRKLQTVAALGVATGLLLAPACDSPKKPAAGSAGEAAASGAKAATGAKPATAATGAAKNTPADAAGTGPKAEALAPAKTCSRYCFEGTPCGDKCLPEGETCAEGTQTTACPGSDRPPAKFKKGDRVLQGLIKADVFAFNKAQGDPVDGPFTLEMAFEGDPALADKANGKLFATMVTTMGDIRCELYEEQTPLTVANFVGLSRGTRPFWDSKAKEWVKRPYYKDILWHRVIDGFMIQTGDHTGGGSGGPGYFVPDEFDPTLSHSGPGILSMANRNRVDRATQKLKVDPQTGQTIGNTGSSQFFVTVAKGKRAAYLDGRHSVFGKCEPKVALEIGKVPTAAMDRPVKEVRLKEVKIERAKK